MGRDHDVMPHIDQASIACGFHGGDPLVMQKTLALAKQHSVMVGAHPSYPDLAGFGRRSMHCSHEEIVAMLNYQISAIDGMARSQGIDLAYVKPHGALYNDMMSKAPVRLSVMQAIAGYHRPLKLMLLATGAAAVHRAEARQAGIELLFEAFADRCYDDNGRLLARDEPGAVHNRDKILAQVKQIRQHGAVTSVNGKLLKLSPDTLCVHGDNAAAISAIIEIRDLIRR